MSLKSAYRKILPQPIRVALSDQLRLLTDGFANKSYAQEGEDMILRRLFETQSTGFYVDVGAHHPMRFSNTYLLYRQGWRGINIDATPGSMRLFQRYRPDDVNLEAAIAATPRELTFHLFNEPALNTLDAEVAERVQRENSAYRVVGKQVVRTRTLAEILDTHLPAGRTIDFLSIDVEGMDLEVLQSNQWERHRPRLVLAESTQLHALEQIGEAPIYRYMAEQGYAPIAKTRNTYFYQDRHQPLL